ncbi:hypothetical protein Afil01_21640 [Actinorhabdospora filicis]|uniref:Uncharacterized protein n=1 Tax=Actinorhabdospora filicis TaxID=1785913 RepID=A0A9W6SK92_9ACTN|nr:hypothetical protein [Actinorhabdospora filicis]GLZ77357.1 hypothetical protein Afil01_21640 [Actinorhabdospora filicis]
MSSTFTAQDKTTLRTAAHGSVALMAWAAGTSSPHRVATNGSFALYAATGPVGYVLAEKKNDLKLGHKSSAALADHVLPAITASVALLANDPAELANFRETVVVAVEAAAQGSKKGVTPTLEAMAAKIHEALGA